MEPITIGIIGIIIMLTMIMLGYNVGMSFIVVGFAGYCILNGFQAGIGVLRSSMFKTGSNYTFVALPLFVMMGQLAFHSGMSTGLYNFARKWLGGLPGGLAAATVGGCAFFAAICGNVNATAATMGTVSLPEMRKNGYNDSLTSGCIAAGGTLGPLIPPSNSFILFGMIAEVSIGELFMAGMVPGIICACMMIATVVIMVLAKPALAPGRQHFSWKERLASLVGVLPIVFLFGGVFGGMFAGVFTVSESGAIGVFLALVYMAFVKKLNWKTLKAVLLGTTKTCAMVCLITMGAYVLNTFLATSRVSAAISDLVLASGLNGAAIIALMVVILVFLGCIMDGIAITLLTLPIFLPIVKAYGFDLIWYGVIHCVCGMIGCLTPPVGMSLFVLANLDKKMTVPVVVKGVWPFIICLVLLLVLLFAFPSLATWLPNLMYT